MDTQEILNRGNDSQLKPRYKTALNIKDVEEEPNPTKEEKYFLERKQNHNNKIYNNVIGIITKKTLWLNIFTMFYGSHFFLKLMTMLSRLLCANKGFSVQEITTFIGSIEKLIFPNNRMIFFFLSSDKKKCKRSF